MFEEVRPQFGMASEERPSCFACFGFVTPDAAGDQIAIRVIAAFHSGLHMIERQLGGRVHSTTVLATERIPPENPIASAIPLPGPH